MTGVVAFVDTETTGLHADLHEVWEVALITPDGAEHEWMLPVSDLAGADLIALSIGRFHERHWQGNGLVGQTFDPSKPHVIERGARPVRRERNVAASEIAKLTHGLHLAGMVVSFDEERLRRLLWGEGLTPSWHYHLVDVEALAAGALLGSVARAEVDGRPGGDEDQIREAATPPWDSAELSLSVGVDPADFDRHTALGDARWARAIYQAVCARRASVAAQSVVGR